MAGLLLAWAGVAAAAETAEGAKVPVIRIGVEFNSPPLSFAEAEGVPQGFTPELLRAMEATGRVKFEIVPRYWSQLLRKFSAGELDALANVQVLAERRQTMEFSIPHASLHGVAYTRPEAVPFTSTTQFSGKKMATLSGTTSQLNATEHHGWGAQIVVFDSWLAMLQAVKNGECDFALVMRPLSIEQPDELGLRREFVNDIVHEFHIAVHVGDHAALEQINEALAEVRQKGTFRALYAKWIGPIEPQPIRLVDLRPYLLPGVAVLALVLGVIYWQRRLKVRWRELASALKISQDMLQTTGRIARVGGWELDLKTQQVFWSDETCRLHGIELGTLPTTEEAINFYAPEYRPIIQAAVQRGIKDGTPWDLELELVDIHGRRFWVRAQGAPELENGKVVRLRGAVQDIDERKRAEARLQSTESRYRSLFDSMKEGFCLFEVKLDSAGRALDLRFIEVNPAFETQTGLQNVQGKWTREVVPRLEDYWYEAYGRVAATGQSMQFENEARELRRWFAVSAFAIGDSPHRRVGAIFHDITDRKRDEMELQRTVREKEALLKEVHHRVKNNMQVISSLLRLETAKRTDPDTKSALRDMQGRIRSMALLHETLYRSGNFAEVDLGAYLRDLGTQFFRGQNLAPHLVQLGFNLSPVKVDIDQAVPCGLIINELLTNALKYGFPEGRTGKVLVGVTMNAAGEVELMVSDDGVGLPPGLDIKQSKSLGLRLVTDLARQLHGELLIGTPAQFTIRFKPKATHDTKPPLASPPVIGQAKEAP